MQPDRDNIEDELNEKQKAFCKRYIFDWNGTKSYKEIYKVESDDVAAVNASRLLSNAKIQAFIEHLKKNLAEVAEISPLMILQEHRKMAFSSIAHLHLTWIERKDFEELTDDQKACIEEISTKIRIEWKYDPENPKEKKPIEVEYIKVKLYNKQKSLDAINVMMGWNSPEKVEVTNPDGSLNLLPPVLLTVPDHILNNLKQKG